MPTQISPPPPISVPFGTIETSTVTGKQVARPSKPWAEWLRRSWEILNFLTNGVTIVDTGGGALHGLPDNTGVDPDPENTILIGTLEDGAAALTDLSTSGGNTYTDADVNAIFAEVEARLAIMNQNFAEVRRALRDARICQDPLVSAPKP